MKGLRIAGGLVIVLTLAGCAGQQLSLGEAAAPAAPAAAVDMSGRWRLSAPGAPSCGMHFAGGPGIRNGAIQPEGGCPGQFFTARHWELSQDGQLTIDERGDDLKFFAERIDKGCIVCILPDRGDRYFPPLKWEKSYVW